jgi:hypothetical protein
MLNLIDQMRVAIPEEVKKAQQILTQRDRVLAQAQEEANRTLNIAREQSEQLKSKDAIVQAAQVRAEQLLSQARLDAENLRHESDDYVIKTLQRAEIELENSLSQVRNGINTLRQEQQQIAATNQNEDLSLYPPESS